MNTDTAPPWHILPTIVFAQFAGTSLWFASNAVMPELSLAFELAEGSVSDLTSAVQFGFIGGRGNLKSVVSWELMTDAALRLYHKLWHPVDKADMKLFVL